jgi:uncharacterized protein (TIGR02246 family)
LEAHNNGDAAAFAAGYARDAVFLTPDRPIIGRQAIQKWFTDFFQSSQHPKNSMAKVDGNAFHVIGTAGNELWATGEYSETVQGKNGEPRPVKSYNFWIFVREGEDWKILVDAWGLTPARWTSCHAQLRATPCNRCRTGRCRRGAAAGLLSCPAVYATQRYARGGNAKLACPPTKITHSSLGGCARRSTFESISGPRTIAAGKGSVTDRPR